MESSDAGGHSYSDAGNIGHAVLPLMVTAEPDTVKAAAATEIAVHSVSPSRSLSAPVIELVTGVSTFSTVMDASIRGTCICKLS